MAGLFFSIKKPFNLPEILKQDFIVDKVQQIYFFIDSFVDLAAVFNMNASVSSLKIILPVGISFYTFQTMSYTIDIYRRRIKDESNFLIFATYVAFFPQLVAGPIVRASTLLPQFHEEHPFDWDNFR